MSITFCLLDSLSREREKNLTARLREAHAVLPNYDLMYKAAEVNSTNHFCFVLFCLTFIIFHFQQHKDAKTAPKCIVQVVLPPKCQP